MYSSGWRQRGVTSRIQQAGYAGCVCAGLASYDISIYNIYKWGRRSWGPRCFIVVKNILNQNID